MSQNPLRLQKKYAERRQKILEEGKKEYEEIHRRMVGKLNASLLEPFAKVLLEKDGSTFNEENAIESIKEILLSQLSEEFNKLFWEPLAVDKLTDLEMLKKHFKDHAGKNWNIKTKTPEERVLPLHMAQRKKMLDFLKKQVEHQNKIIEEKSAVAEKRRKFLHQVEKDGSLMNECVLHHMQGTEEEAIEEAMQNYLKESDIIHVNEDNLEEQNLKGGANKVKETYQMETNTQAEKINIENGAIHQIEEGKQVVRFEAHVPELVKGNMAAHETQNGQQAEHLMAQASKAIKENNHVSQLKRSGKQASKIQQHFVRVSKNDVVVKQQKDVVEILKIEQKVSKLVVTAEDVDQSKQQSEMAEKLLANIPEETVEEIFASKPKVVEQF